MAKQSGGNTAQRVEALVRPTVEGMGLRLWDVVFEKEGPDWYLRVLIDKDGTMDTDTCADVSHALDPILDEADPIDQSYYLEVGSPGLGRKLTRPEHYEALKGQKIRAKLIRPNADGVRELAGILTGRDALEFIMAGVAAVQVGTANFSDPRACEKITDGIAASLENVPTYAHRFEGTRFDCGSKQGFLDATIHFARKRGFKIN